MITSEQNRKNISGPAKVIFALSVGLMCLLLFAGVGFPLSFGMALGAWVGLNRAILPSFDVNVSPFDSVRDRERKNALNLEDINRKI